MNPVRFTCMPILASFALIFAAAVSSEETTNCPHHVPTTDDTSEIAGHWYLTQMMAIGIPLPEIKCFKQTNTLNSAGSLTSTQTLMETQSDAAYFYENHATPIDHVRARLGYESIISPDNIAIYTILKIVPRTYFITAGCITVEEVLGFKLNVFSHASVLDDQTLNDIKQFLADSILPNNLTTVDQVNCPDDPDDTPETA